MGYDVLSSCSRDETNENKLNMWIIQCLDIGIAGSEDYESILGVHVDMWLSWRAQMSSNEKGASKTVGVLAAETNHVERLHGLEVWNGPETLSVMTKRDWSSIHSEVKEAESMKIHSSGVGSRMEQNKEEK